jgi:periplasmic divalent cation tolerance protein
MVIDIQPDLPGDEVTGPLFRWLWVTVAQVHEAEAIAQDLLERRLAACVNIIPGMTSLYRWQGRICRDAEVAMVVKTTVAVVESCQQRIIALHNADVPCVLVFEPDTGHPPFLQWIADQVAPVEGC